MFRVAGVEETEGAGPPSTSPRKPCLPPVFNSAPVQAHEIIRNNATGTYAISKFCIVFFNKVSTSTYAISKVIFFALLVIIM